MKISVDDKEIFSLSEPQKKVIMNDIHEDIFDEDMKRRLEWVLMHKYQRCFERLKSEWETRLKNSGVKSMPLDNDEFAQLVFSHPDYKSRKERETPID